MTNHTPNSHDQHLPGVNASDTYTCAICGHPMTNTPAGINPALDADGRCYFKDTIPMLTCEHTGCPAAGITATPGSYMHLLNLHKVLSTSDVINTITRGYFNVDDVPVTALDIERARAEVFRK